MNTSNVTVDAVAFTSDDPGKALEVTTNVMTAHPESNVIASHMSTGKDNLQNYLSQGWS